MPLSDLGVFLVRHAHGTVAIRSNQGSCVDLGRHAGQRQRTLLLASANRVDHNVRRVVAMSDHIYVMSLGEITAEGTPQDFAGDLHAQVREWLGINF